MVCFCYFSDSNATTTTKATEIMDNNAEQAGNSRDEINVWEQDEEELVKPRIVVMEDDDVEVNKVHTNK